MRRKIGTAFFMMVLLSPLLSQAKDLGHIRGQVKKDGEPLSGVAVILERLALTKITDNNGVYLFTRVPPGEYTVTFAQGENTSYREGVSVTAGDTTVCDMDVDWRISIAETITVFGVSRQRERVVDAPAAVTVIDITASKMTMPARPCSVISDQPATAEAPPPVDRVRTYRAAPVRTITASAAVESAICESTCVASRRKPQFS